MAVESLIEEVTLFRADAQRWLKSLDDMQGMETTAFYGIMARACEHLDHIVTTAALHALAVTDSATTATVQAITGGKPPDKLTMGQCVQLLIALRSDLNRVCNAYSHSREVLFPKQLVGLLQSLSRTRNDFAHRRFPGNCTMRDGVNKYIRAANSCTNDFLSEGLRLTASPFFVQLAVMPKATQA